MENEALYRDRPVWTAIWSLVIPSVLTILVMVFTAKRSHSPAALGQNYEREQI